MRAWNLLVTIAVASALAPGCGEEEKAGNATGVAAPSGDEAEVRDVLAMEIEALAAGDGDAACELLSAGGEQQVISIINQIAEQIERPLDFQDCDTAVSATLGGEEPLVPELGQLAEPARDASVVIEIPTARARIASEQGKGEIEIGLERVDGQWRITSLDELLLGPPAGFDSMGVYRRKEVVLT